MKYPNKAQAAQIQARSELVARKRIQLDRMTAERHLTNTQRMQALKHHWRNLHIPLQRNIILPLIAGAAIGASLLPFSYALGAALIVAITPLVFGLLVLKEKIALRSYMESVSKLNATEQKYKTVKRHLHQLGTDSWEESPTVIRELKKEIKNFA